MIRVAMTSELSKQRNDAITYFTYRSISRYWELFFQNHARELFPPIAASMFVKFKRNLFSLRFSVADQRPHTVQREDFYAIEICLVTACITSLRFFFTTKPRPKTALSSIIAFDEGERSPFFKVRLPISERGYRAYRGAFCQILHIPLVGNIFVPFSSLF